MQLKLISYSLVVCINEIKRKNNQVDFIYSALVSLESHHLLGNHTLKNTFLHFKTPFPILQQDVKWKCANPFLSRCLGPHVKHSGRAMLQTTKVIYWLGSRAQSRKWNAPECSANTTGKSLHKSSGRRSALVVDIVLARSDIS